MLWRRLPADDPGISWEGDRETAMATLSGSLVP
jgi:hypothetical protein